MGETRKPINKNMDSESVELLRSAINNVANAITPIGMGGKCDEYGGYIESHTEVMISVANALGSIAHAISDLACAIAEKDITAGGLSEIADAIRESAEK